MKGKSLGRVPRRLWPALMEAAGRAFPRGNEYGVFGFGIGPKRVEGMARSGATLIAYVRTKVKNPRARVPSITLRSQGERFAVTPDVVATGGVARTHRAEDQLQFMGLFPGSAIHVEGRRGAWGGVGCILGHGRAPTHLVTAGHLFPEDASEAFVAAARPGQPKQRIGKLVANLLDKRPDGLNFPIDAAAVELLPAGREMALATRDDGPRFESIEWSSRIEGRSAQAFRPSSNGFSDETVTTLLPSRTTVRQEGSAGRSVFEVFDVLRTAQVITWPGDSGCVLVTTGAPRSALGICVGTDSSSSLFEPLSRAVHHLRRQIGDETLELWV